MPYTAASKVRGDCADLRKYWDTRGAKFPDWYKILMLEDKLKQVGMESFTSNDPRTFYNLALHLLTPKVIPHHVRGAVGRAVEAGLASINNFLAEQWERLDIISRRRGHQRWLRRLVSLMLATGWYSVLAYATEDELVAEAWNPAEVFPDLGDEELIACAHIYSITTKAAARKAALRNWSFKPRLLTGNTTVYDLWYVEGGAVRNVVVFNSEIVRPDDATPFPTIPILVSPVGGLPDQGTIIEGDDTWKAHIGEAIIAVNEGVYNNYNRQMTFLQQLLRDTAQPRWFERSREGNILDEESIFKRGAIFKGAPEDSVELLPVPAVPVDIRTTMFDLQGMMQRGSLPYALYGNVQQEMASYLMSQIASAATQILGDYRDAAQAVLAGVDKLWLTHMRDNRYAPYGFALPDVLPAAPREIEVEVGVEVSIPGDLIQRVSTARMLNPQFQLSPQTIMDLLFPEVQDPMTEEARVNASRALQHPTAIAISTIQAWRSEAQRLRDAKDTASADLFEKAAAKLEAMLGAEAQQARLPQRPEGAGPPAGEIIPREVQGYGAQ